MRQTCKTYSALTEFPSVVWGEYEATFTLSTRLHPTHVVVFPFAGDLIVLADIKNRGWCIPSGHIESGESPLEAAGRESMEEAGVELDRIQEIGAFILTSKTGNQAAAIAYIANVTNILDHPTGSDSAGRELFRIEDICETYYQWDELLDMTFTFAWQQAQSKLRMAYPIPNFLTKLN